MEYDFVILLCASKSRDDRFDEFPINKDGLKEYLGGQIRMEAAIDFALHVKTYIIIGGKDDDDKVNSMKKYLEKKFQEYLIKPTPKIIRIQSDTDTTGNLWALRFIFHNAGKVNLLKMGKVGILTNFYHLPRVIRFATDIFKDLEINFVPIAAEAVITRHLPAFTIRPEATILRIQNDINGLRDWERGEYRKQNEVAESSWHHKCLDDDILNALS